MKVLTATRLLNNWLALLLLTPFGLFAQNGIIKGKISDKISNEAIPFANVLVIGTDFGTTTDENGNSASAHTKLFIWKQSDGLCLSSATLLAQIQKILKTIDH